MAHIHEKIDFTASAFIVYGDTVVLHKHKKLGIWLQPGGHIELNEDPVEAVLREAKEETGLDIELVGAAPLPTDVKSESRQIMAPRFISRHYFDASRAHEHIDMVYFARSASGDISPEEVGGEVRWFTKEEVMDPSLDTLPDIRRYATLALEELAT